MSFPSAIEGSWPPGREGNAEGAEGRRCGGAAPWSRGNARSPDGLVLGDRLAVTQKSPAPVTLSFKIYENLTFAIKRKNVPHSGKENV